jgi:hypothetical protein
MPDQHDQAYHTERARAELDAAYRAGRQEAAEAHLRLFALHVGRARALKCAAPADPPAIELEWLERFAPLHERSLRTADA